MKLTQPIATYLDGPNPSHTSRQRLASHITFLKQDAMEAALKRGGYLNNEGKATKKALADGLIDTCEGKALWNLKKTKATLLELTRKASKPTVAKTVVPPTKTPTRPVYTDLENIGTYFGVGKNKIGSWLDQLGLRGPKPVQINESGDVDMLDMANQSKNKFNGKVPTEKAIEMGYALVETIEYTKKGEVRSFEKYSWHLEKVKAVLVRAGHELDTERKLLLKGKGKNSDVAVSSIDEKVNNLYNEWKKQFRNPQTRKASWKVFDRQPKGVIQRIEMKLGSPRFIQDKKYLKEENLKKLNP